MFCLLESREEAAPSPTSNDFILKNYLFLQLRRRPTARGGEEEEEGDEEVEEEAVDEEEGEG